MAVTDPAELLQLLGLGPEWLQPAVAASARFALRLPRGFVRRMRRELRYCLRRHFPYVEESAARDGFAPALAAIAANSTITVLNQAVLLRGVKHRAADLVELSEALFAAGALPCCLHVLDPVAGAARFDVRESVARRPPAEVASRLPGHLVPRLGREQPRAPAKTMLPPASR